ncbi:MAG TPA: O-antigen polymerase [Alphaproteobacteria bacterium]|nr:O-antigen polymerase [Alphaproteobacteria bacterium]
MIEFGLYFHLLVFLLIAGMFVVNKNMSMFHPLAFYLLFHGIVFVIRPFMVHYLKFDGRWTYMGFFPTEAQFLMTLAVSSVALVVFATASWWAGRADVNFAEARLPDFNSAQKRAFFWMALMLAPLTLYSALFAVQDVGYDTRGDIQMSVDLATGNTVYVNTTGYIVDAQTMLGSLAILFMWRFRFVWWTWAPVVMFIAYRAFLGGGRWPMITTIFTLILIQLFRTHKRWFRLRYLAIFVPIFILFQNVGFDRNYLRDIVGGGSVPVAEFRDERSWLQKQDNPDFANFEFLAFVLWAVPDQSRTYIYFSQYLQIFTEPIPRILWSEKPIGSPIKFFELNDFGNFVGLTVSLVGDGWLSLGWFGMIITLGLVGLFLGWLHRRFWANMMEPAKVLMYCVFLPLTVQWFRDGGISIAKFALFTVLPVALWLGFTRFFMWLDRQRSLETVRMPARRR